MIEGLKLRVTSAELRDHCSARAQHHRSRAAEKAAELPGLRESMERIKSRKSPSTVANMSKHANYRLDPDEAVHELEQDVQGHQNKSLVFDYFAAHLFDEDYTLKEDDLIRLEILARYG